MLDVFTDVPLTGNALAVVHDADAIDDERMLAFARETLLAETTFVQSTTAAGADYRNRIFSMAGELPFAGHPSLGTAVAIARARGVSGSANYTQETGAGLQRVDVEGEGDRFQASVLQEPPSFGEELDQAPLLSALGLEASDVHPQLPSQVVATGLPHVMLPLTSFESLGRITRDDQAVDELLARHEAFGLYACWFDPSRGEARARLFARSAQTREDPATGSAAGPLCAYLNARLGIESVSIAQGVEMGRPSRLLAEITEDRVRVSGAVVAVIDGVLRL